MHLETTEYSVIEAALTETERGRRFLADYAARHRGADTRTLLNAIARLENAVVGERSVDPDDGQTRLKAASSALDTIVQATEQAASDILDAAEEIQEVAWTLRESGTDGASCDVLDRRATEIRSACSFRDLTVTRMARVRQTLHDLEERFASMTAIWGIEARSAPYESAARARAVEVGRSEVRGVDDDRGAQRPLVTHAPMPHAEPEPAPVPESKPTGSGVDTRTGLHASFAEIDRLSIEDRIALFA